MIENKKRASGEAIGFVAGALNLDKDRFIEVSQMVSNLIEELQRSGANPVTIYYATRALEGYAQDRLTSFAKAAEKKVPDLNITSDSIRDACDELFLMALEDVGGMGEGEKKNLIEEARMKYRREKLGYIG